MRAREWTIASLYGDPEDYGIPSVPINVDEQTNEKFMTAENTVKMKR